MKDMIASYIAYAKNSRKLSRSGLWSDAKESSAMARSLLREIREVDPEKASALFEQYPYS